MAQKTDGTSWFNTDYNTTEGTDFWVTFMRNSGSDKSDNTDMILYVYATAREDTKVTITNPNQNANTISFNIKAGQQVKQQIPNDMGYMQLPQEVSNFGLHVTSTKPISLYATSHHNSGKYDGTNVLPTRALVGSYVLQTYINDQYATEFAIVATSYQRIDVHLMETTLDQTKFNSGKLDTVKTEEKDFSITLSPGQTYLYRSSTIMTSLSGSSLCSTQPFALIQGGQSAKIPGDPENHIFHQSYSNDQWGHTFVVTPSHMMINDVVRITAAQDNTVVYKNGDIVATLSSRETYMDTLKSVLQHTATSTSWKPEYTYTPDVSVYITSHPSTCFLYATGYASNHPNDPTGAPIESQSTDYGAPAMTPVIPQENAMRSNIFATFNELTQTIKHYVNIVTLTSEVSGMRLDGTNISGEFKSVPNNKYSYVIKEVTGTAHTIQNINGRVTSNFTARVYGLGKSSTTRESYAYAAGSRVNRSIDFLINDQYIKEKTICINQSLKFTSIINGEFESRLWDFGDMDTRTDSIVPAKKWDQAGDYTVSLLVTKKTPLCENIIVDTVKALIHVREEYKYKDNTKHCKAIHTRCLD